MSTMSDAEIREALERDLLMAAMIVGEVYPNRDFPRIDGYVVAAVFTEIRVIRRPLAEKDPR